MTPDTPADGEALYDDRTRPLLLQQAETRGAEDWRHEDAEAVIARLLAKIDSLSGALIPRPAEPAQAAQVGWEARRWAVAVGALGAMPEGYCFCSTDRIGDDSKTHEPECADLRALMKRYEDDRI